MEPIHDKFELDHRISRLREYAGNKLCRSYAIEYLSLMVEDARFDLRGPNLDWARGLGDLDDTSCPWRLMTEHRGLLNVQEEAAADLLLTLYSAIEELQFELGPHVLSHDRLNEIDRKFNTLLSWRLFGVTESAYKGRSRAGRETARRKASEHENVGMLALFLLEDGASRRNVNNLLRKSLKADGVELSESQINRILCKCGI